MAIHLEINGVDYSDAIYDIDLEPAGPGKVGTGTLRLLEPGSSIYDRQTVKLWRVDSGGHLVRRYFGGYVGGAGTGRLSIAPVKTWDIPLQDYNLAGKRVVADVDLVTDAGVHINPGTFAAQVAAAVLQWQEFGGTPSVYIDATSKVVNLTGATVLPAIGGLNGKNLDYALLQIFKNAQAVNPALRPRRYFGLDDDFSPGAVFGPPVLWVYNAADLTSTDADLSDLPTGGQGSIRVGSFKRTTASPALVNRRQSVYGDPPALVTGSDVTSHLTYPFDLAGDGYWHDEALEDRDSGDSPHAQAVINRNIAATAYPRETVELQTRTWVEPGRTVLITWGGDLLNVPYRVVGTHLTFWKADPDSPWVDLTLGAVPREVGVDDGDDIGNPPIVGDHVRPGKPTALAGTPLYDGATHSATVTGTFHSPADLDYAYTELRFHERLNGGAWGDWETHTGLAGSPNSDQTYTLPLGVLHAATPGNVYETEIFAQAYDHNHNGSAFSDPITVPNASVASPAPPTIDTRYDSHWRGGTVSDLKIYLTASPDLGEDGDYYWLKLQPPRGEAQVWYAPWDATEYLFKQCSPGLTYQVSAVSVTRWDDPGPESTPIPMTVAPALDPDHAPGPGIDQGDYETADPLGLYGYTTGTAVGTAVKVFVSTAVVYNGQGTFLFTDDGSNGAASTTLLGRVYKACQVGQTWVARFRTGNAALATGTLTVALIYRDKALGVQTTTTIWSGTPSTTVGGVLYEIPYTIPSGTAAPVTVQGVRVGYASSGTANSVYISEVEFVPQIRTDNLADTAVTTGKIAPGAVTIDTLAVGSTPANLIGNPSFEQGTAGWARVDGSGTFSTTTASDAPSGDLVGVWPGGSSIGVGARAVPVTPGRTYQVRLTVKASAGGGAWYFRMFERADYPPGGYITAALATSYTDKVSGAVPPTSWTVFDYAYTVPAGIYWLGLTAYNLSAGGTTLWADDAYAVVQAEANAIGSGAIIAGKIGVGGLSASNQLAAGVVDSAALAALAVTNAKLGLLSVDTGNLIANAVTTAKLALLAVDSTILASGAVTAGKIAAGGVSASNQFGAGVVDTTALAALAVTNAKLALLSVNTGNLIANAVTTAKLALLAVDSTILAAGAVTAGKIAVGGVSASNQLAADVVDSAAIATGAVGSGEIAAGAVIAGKIGVGGVSAANQFAADVVDSAAIAAGAVGSSEIGTGAVIAGKIATGAINLAALFAAGVVDSAALGAAAVIAGKIASGAINASSLFGAGVVDSAALGTGSVTAGKIATGGVSASAQLAAGVVDSSALAALAVTNAKLALLSVDTGNLIANAVTTAKLALLAVDSTILAAGAVTAGKVATGGISASTQLAAGVVDTTALGLGAVTGAKVASGAIVDSKLGTLTDVLKFQLDIETAELKFYSAPGGSFGGAYMGRLSFLPGTNIVSLSAINAGATTTLELAGGASTRLRLGTTGAIFNTALTYLNSALSSTTTLTAAHSTVLCTNTITINLPAASGLAGRRYTVANVGTGVVTVDGNASETINGRTTWPLTKYQSVEIECDGAGWIIVTAFDYMTDQSGTAFPTTGLLTDMKFYRTDLHVDCFWDGTRWTGPLLEKSFTLRTPAGAGGLAPVVATIGDAPIAQDRGIQLDRITVASYIVTTSNGSNFWTFTFFIDNGAGTRTNLGNVNTSAQAANAWKPLSLTSFSSNNFAAATQVVTNVDTGVTGTPGNLYPAFSIRYREIYT